MKAQTKREQVQTVWQWTGEQAPNSPYLDDAHLAGVGHPGTAYMTYRYAEFEYLLRIVIAFKSTPQMDQRRLLQDNPPWTFMEWLDSQPGSDRRLERNALLYFMFPDEFERNTSRDHRRQIYEAFKNKLPENERIKARTKNNGDYDKAILAIRRVLEKELGTTELDFYQDSLNNQWFAEYKDAKRKSFTSWFDEFFSDRGLQLNQSGRDTKIQKLQEKKAISTETGYWTDESGLTAKPPRWLIHFDLTQANLAASVPEGRQSRRIGFANTKGGDSGALAVRILGVAKTDVGTFEVIDTWEWLLLFCFPGGLKPGSAAQTFDDFDPVTGELTYMGEQVPYIFSALLTENTAEETFTATVGAQKRMINYRDATAALTKLINVRTNGGGDA